MADYLVRDVLTSFVPNFVQNAENKLYRSLNLRNEETVLSLSITSGTATVPTDFKALKFAYFNTAPAELLQWTTIEEIYNDYPDRSVGSTPSLISREGANFVFGPASKDGTLTGIYYAKTDPLRTTDPNWYATNAPEVLLYASLLEAEPFIQNDARIAVWQSMFLGAVETLKAEQDNAEFSMGNLTQRAS